MKPKSLRAFSPRQSRLAAYLSLALTFSLLVPFVPATVTATSAGAPGSAAPRAAFAPAALAFAPSITATKTDSYPDPDNDGKAVPGDTITYTVQIDNNGSDATGVIFSDTIDANTTFVPGSVTTTPVAINDNYSAIGNVRISVPSGSGVTANDADPDGGSVSAVPGSTTSANGGDVTVNADGSFTYNPPPGFEGADTFTYTVAGASSPSNTATVTVNVAGMIWFIDDNAAAGGDGRLTSPFNALTGAGSYDAVAADDQNDNIFLYSGVYTGGLTLQSGQALIGQGATASLATITGLTPPSYSDPLPTTGGANPVIGGTSGITVATNNLIRGVTIQNTGGTGISGSNFGTLAVADTTVNSTGAAVILDNGLVNASFQSLSSTASGTNGVSLTNLAINSVFSGGPTTVSDAAGVAILIANVGSGSSLSFGATDILSRNGTGIDVDNAAGSLSFGATNIPNPDTSTGYGIRVTDSSAAVSFGSANISDTKLTTAQLDVNSDFIPENEGNGDAIFLSNNTGSFALNGGVIANCDNDCIDVRNSSNLSLANVIIQSPGVTASGGSGTGGHGISAINLTGTNSITGTTVTDFDAAARDGLRIINNVPTAMTMTVSGSTFTHATAVSTSGNGIHVRGRDNANMSLVVDNNSVFSNLAGAAIQHAAGDNTDSTATVNLTVQNSTFQNSAQLGQNTVHVGVFEGGKAAVVISGNTFDNVARTLSDNSGVIDINGDATDAGNSLSVSITGNTIQNIGANTGDCDGAGPGTLPCLSRRAIDVSIDDNTGVTGTIVIDGNILTNIQRAGIILGVTTIYTGPSIAAKVTNNTIGTSAARVGLGGTGESGVRIENSNNTGSGLNVNFSGNTVRNGNGGAGSALNTPGVFLRAQNQGGIAATLTGNDIETSTSGVVAELRVDTSINSPVVCLDANGNTLDSGNGRIALNRNAGALDVEQASASALATANGIPAGNVTVVGPVSFGIACAPPPLAMMSTGANVTTHVAALSPSLADELLTNLSAFGAWGSNSKAAANGLSYMNSDANASLAPEAVDTVVRPARAITSAAPVYALAAAPVAFSGETVNVNIGTLPAGKSMTITFQVTIDNSINVPQVSNQGTVSGSNFSSVSTDDPDTAAPGDPTVTPVFLGTPPEISCPADISVGTDPGVSTASVAFNVTATGTPAPTVTCKIGATTITSPHTFPLGETTVSCTATNGVEPDDSCSFKVTVTDDEAPVIDCPDDIVVNLPLNSNATGVPVNFTVTATDNADATPTIQTSVASGSVFPVGTTTVTATATDDAGNQSQCTFNVTVLYNFTGFFSPVSNPPVINEVKAGQGIPVKFSLSGNKGLNIFAAGYPASQQVGCNDNLPVNVLEETDTSGGNTVSYNASSDTYTYNWKTEKSWAGTCRVLVVKLADGSTHTAYFKFK